MATGSPITGGFSIDVLVPNNETQSASFALSGTRSGTASLFSSTAWTGGNLDTCLGISASPANPFGVFLASAQALDPGVTSFFVYQASLGTATLQSSINPNVSPLETISPDLPLASYIVGFLDAFGAVAATGNGVAIFETTSPPPPGVPEPASLALLGTSLFGLGVVVRRRKSESV